MKTSVLQWNSCTIMSFHSIPILKSKWTLFKIVVVTEIVWNWKSSETVATTQSAVLEVRERSIWKPQLTKMALQNGAETERRIIPRHSGGYAADWEQPRRGRARFMTSRSSVSRKHEYSSKTRCRHFASNTASMGETVHFVWIYSPALLDFSCRNSCFLFLRKP